MSWSGGFFPDGAEDSAWNSVATITENTPPLPSGAKDEICTDISDELRFKLKDDGRSERWIFI